MTVLQCIAIVMTLMGPTSLRPFITNRRTCLQERKVILEMNVQITSLSETEPKEKQHRKQNKKGNPPHTNAQNKQHKCHGNWFTAKLNKVPASINFHIFPFMHHQNYFPALIYESVRLGTIIQTPNSVKGWNLHSDRADFLSGQKGKCKASSLGPLWKD